MKLFAACILLGSLATPAAGGQAPTQPAAACAATACGAVRGEAVYPDRAPISGAQLILTPATGPAMKATAEADGTFLFEQVPAGAFTLTVKAGDVQTATVSGTVSPAGVTDLDELMLKLAAVHTEVTAITQQQAAELEVRMEEHQRILHAIPNYLVVYDAEPVPLSTGQKFRLSTRTLIDPVSIGISAAIAGGEQASGSYPGFGPGRRGYARRLGANLGDNTSGMLLTGAVFPALFHQDPRFYFRDSGSTMSRLGYVLKQTVEQKGDNGRWQAAWSNTCGQVSSALISNTYYPHPGHHWGSQTGQFFGLSIASTGISNLLQEFVFGRVTTRREQ